AVSFPYIVDIVCSHDRAAAGHILDNQRRLSGQMLAQMLGDEARPEIDSSSHTCADDDLDSFAFEVRLSQSPVSATNKVCGGQNHQAKRVNFCYQRFFHTRLSSSLPLQLDLGVQHQSCARIRPHTDGGNVHRSDLAVELYREIR